MHDSQLRAGGLVMSEAKGRYKIAYFRGVRRVVDANGNFVMVGGPTAMACLNAAHAAGVEEGVRRLATHLQQQGFPTTSEAVIEYVLTKSPPGA